MPAAAPQNMPPAGFPPLGFPQAVPQMVVIERDYPNTYRKFTALGPLMATYSPASIFKSSV